MAVDHLDIAKQFLDVASERDKDFELSCIASQTAALIAIAEELRGVCRILRTKLDDIDSRLRTGLR